MHFCWFILGSSKGVWLWLSLGWALPSIKSSTVGLSVLQDVCILSFRWASCFLFTLTDEGTTYKVTHWLTELFSLVANVKLNLERHLKYISETSQRQPQQRHNQQHESLSNLLNNNVYYHASSQSTHQQWQPSVRTIGLRLIGFPTLLEPYMVELWRQ